MIVERFIDGDPIPVYRRLQREGRLLPEGLEFVDSWVGEDLKQCFQVMKTDDRQLLDNWMATWSDLVDFEVLPVIESDEAAKRVAASDPWQLSEESKQFTRQAWRELGFFYRRDDESKVWSLTGSKTGLQKLVGYLRSYCQCPSSEKIGEHDHLGPHCYFTITTSETASIGQYAIYGALADLRRLADLIETELADGVIGETLLVAKKYVDDAEYELALNVKEATFDPASLDPQLH